MSTPEAIRKQSAEADLLKEIEALKNSSLDSGDLWFLVEYHWYHKMMDFLQGNSDNPGPVDNTNLVEENNARLKENLQDELDYVLLPERAWTIIRDKFGVISGQTAISRKVIDMGVFVKHKTVEIYPLELDLALYSEPDKANTISFSRMSTPNDVRKEARSRFQLGSAAQIRLYQKQDNNNVFELVPEDKSREPLNDLCFTNRQKIIVDVEENGQWHITDEQTGSNVGAGTSGTNTSYAPVGEAPTIFRRGPASLGAAAQTTPGLCGLSNLGNTCFMNSALQCMVNASPLTDYFLSDRHKEEINETNPLGMHGEIAQTFGELCKQMWSGRCSTAAPRIFKLTVGRFAPQFSGYQQQDSQELMAFLLDGLHEDLNRIRQKPYIEVKDDQDRPDEAVAAEAWSNYKKRNDSVIVDLFHGLLKSTVVCPECNKVSVTFDPFCYLSLPLPAKKERQIVANFVPLDAQKPILKCKVTVPKNGTINDLVEAMGSMVGAKPSQLLVSEVYGSRIYKLFDGPSLLSLIMDRDDIYIYEMDEVAESDQPVLVVFYNRVVKNKGYFNNMNPTSMLVGLPAPVLLQKSRLSQQQLKAAAERAFKRFLSLPTPGDNWWQSDSGSDSGVEENCDAGTIEQMDVDDGTGSGASGQQPSLFVMRVVNSHGTSTFEEIWPTNGRIDAEPSSELYIALDWHPVAAEKFLDLDVQNHVQQHDSLLDSKTAKKPLCLSDCLDLFTTTEKLGEDDLWYCPRCKKHQQATKKFDVWSLPEILIIHLKRFSYTRIWRDKIEGLVDYPLRDLDLTRWIINKGHPSCVYDLIAVSNHYGGLGGGHYTAYAKNKPTGKWYNFDDSSVTQMNENGVVTKSGYVLVYIRRRGVATIDAGTDPNVEMEGEE